MLYKPALKPCTLGRFGFRNRPELRLAEVPPECFLAKRFDENITRGEVTFHEEFWRKAD